MNPLSEFGRVFLILGVIFIAVGALLMLCARLPIRWASHLGHMPGDIAYRGRHGSFYFPVVTCFLLSAVLTLALWIVNHFRR